MDLPIMIVLAVVCIAIGFVFSNLIHLLRSPGREGERTDPGAPEGAAAGAQQAGPASLLLAPELEKPGAGSRLHIWRGVESQAIVVELDGKVARSPADLDREQLEVVMAARSELEGWLDLPAPAAPSPLDLPEAALDAGTASAIKPARLSLNPIDMLSNALRTEVHKPAITEKSLAVQVDEVLQEKLQGTPLAKRGIRLLDSPDKGLVVQVGIEKYAGVEEVPDPEIRELIHESVAEWGKRNAWGK